MLRRVAIELQAALAIERHAPGVHLADGCEAYELRVSDIPVDVDNPILRFECDCRRHPLDAAFAIKG